MLGEFNYEPFKRVEVVTQVAFIKFETGQQPHPSLRMESKKAVSGLGFAAFTRRRLTVLAVAASARREVLSVAPEEIAGEKAFIF